MTFNVIGMTIFAGNERNMTDWKNDSLMHIPTQGLKIHVEEKDFTQDEIDWLKPLSKKRKDDYKRKFDCLVSLEGQIEGTGTNNKTDGRNIPAIRDFGLDGKVVAFDAIIDQIGTRVRFYTDTPSR